MSSEIEIKATCPTCGETKLKESGMLLALMDWGNGSTYTFFCPTCKEEVVKAADSQVIQLLKNVVHVKHVHVPLEIVEGCRTGPTLTTDDLMDFVIELYNDVDIRVSDAPKGSVQLDCQPIRSTPPVESS